MKDVLDVMTWPRAERSKFNLGAENGLYAIFLRPGAHLPKIEPGVAGLIYIGKASGAKGLKGRCHFLGKTRNHSPRKSLAFLLREILTLAPELVRKPNCPPTWTLETQSETRLTDWMIDNLLLAIAHEERPEPTERLLLHKYSPPLNLTGCLKSSTHQAISDGRKLMQMQAIASCS
jgi:GIY-YIG catalytic domain